MTCEDDDFFESNVVLVKRRAWRSNEYDGLCEKLS